MEVEFGSDGDSYITASEREEADTLAELHEKDSSGDMSVGSSSGLGASANGDTMEEDELEEKGSGKESAEERKRRMEPKETTASMRGSSVSSGCSEPPPPSGATKRARVDDEDEDDGSTLLHSLFRFSV